MKCIWRLSCETLRISVSTSYAEKTIGECDIPEHGDNLFESDLDETVSQWTLVTARFDSNGGRVRFDESRTFGSEEVHPGVVLDFYECNDVEGVEVLRVKKPVPVKTRADAIRGGIASPVSLSALWPTGSH